MDKLDEELPPGAEVPPAIISLDMGPQCKGCTHYKEEHLENFEHCVHIMYYLPTPEDLKPWEKTGRVPKPRKLCNCKEFVE